MWMENASAESEKLRLANEELRRMYGSHQQLRKQVEIDTATIEYLKVKLSKCFQGLSTALLVLEELQNEVLPLIEN